MIDYSLVEKECSEETKSFIDKTLYYLSRNIQMMVIRYGNTSREFPLNNSDEAIAAMLMSYRELSEENATFLDNSGVAKDVQLSMKKLNTSFSREEKERKFSSNSGIFHLKEDSLDKVTPEMIICKHIKVFLKHEINNDSVSNIYQLFGGPNSLYSFNDILYERAKERSKKNSLSK
jgi:hypothetical protein